MGDKILVNFALVLQLIFISGTSSAEAYLGAAAGSTNYGNSFDGSTSLELTAGYRLYDNLAIEMSYLDLGDETFTADNNTKTDFTVDGIHFALLTIVPLARDFELFGRFGVYNWDVDSNNITTSSWIRSKNDEDDSDYTYGGGIIWHLSDNLGLRLLYQEVDVRGQNFENVSAGFTFSF